MSESIKVVLAAGGTGGHMFPAAALAGYLQKQGIGVALCTDKRGESFQLGGQAIPTCRLRAASPSLYKNKVLRSVRAVVAMVLGTFQALFYLRRTRPAVVLGFGGYPAVPTCLAAVILRIPLLLHEQNAVLGRANQFLAKYAKYLATSFDKVHKINTAIPMRHTGNPVRAEIALLARDPYPPPTLDGKFHLLITGGSQGARIFSRVVPEAISLLPESLQKTLFISQQCRAEDIETVRKHYAGLGVSAELATFISDMPARLKDSHLVICRSGASTVAELTASGKPSILVPFAAAMDDHQTANARALADAEAAWLMPQDAFQPEALAAKLEAYLTNPALLIAMAAKTKALGQPQAVEALGALVKEFVGGYNKTGKATKAEKAA
ncbi:MAG: undecaprenyldiphospho-muramoylpentapeptide beta-N-acetylglucosaminyltransferase [Dongiaceae bacterium]